MGRCFRTLFGIPLGPGALPTLRPLMASRTSSGLVNFGSLAGKIMDVTLFEMAAALFIARGRET